MKQIVVPLLFFAILTGACLSFYDHAVTTKDGLDAVAKTLSGLKNTLPAGSKISIWMIGAPDDLYLQIRNCLAPIHTDTKYSRYDTALIVFNYLTDMKQLDLIKQRRTVLWETKDNCYFYVLIKNK
jgi:hypothetical protein